MKSIVVANWKMNPQTFREAKKLFEATRAAVDTAKRVSLIVAPPTIFLRELSGSYRGKKLSFAIQTLHFDKEGAQTGETSIIEAKDARISYALIGHAERRALGETNDDTRKKVAAALAQRIVPILCVGETARSNSGEYFNVVKEELRTGFLDVPKGAVSRVIVAYEPIWAIGAERAMSPRDMHEMAIFIRKTLVEAHGEKAMNVKVLYGGAVSDENAGEMMRDGDVQGLLVGRASTEAERFGALLRAVEAA